MPRSPRTPRYLCAALAAFAVTLGFTATATAGPATLTSKGWKTDPEAWGVNDRTLMWNLTDADLAPRIAAIQKLRAKWVRFTVNWARIQEAGPGTFRWAELDSMVKRLAKAGIRWRPVTLDPPWWLVADAGFAGRQPATSSDRVADFVDALLARYGQGGTFWAANPTVPAKPVLDVELHNEPNHTYFWGFDPETQWYRTDHDGTGWAELYGPALDTLAEEYPSVRFWMGGLAGLYPSAGTPSTTFIYNAFRTHPSLRETLYGSGLHIYPYSGSPSVYSEPSQAHTAVMSVLYALHAYGRQDMQLQINELGASKVRVPDESNRTAIFTTIADLARSNCTIQSFAAFETIGAEADQNYFDDWFGLVSKSGTLYPEGSAWASRVAGYNAGTIKGSAQRVCL